MRSETAVSLELLGLVMALCASCEILAWGMGLLQAHPLHLRECLVLTRCVIPPSAKAVEIDPKYVKAYYRYAIIASARR